MKRLPGALAIAAAVATLSFPGTAQAGIEIIDVHCGTGIGLDAPLGWSSIGFRVTGLESGIYYYVGVTSTGQIVMGGQVAGGNVNSTDFYGSLTLLILPASAVTADPFVTSYDPAAAVFTTTIVVPTCTAGKIEALEQAVAALDVNSGVATSLDVKLDHVRSALEAARANSTTVACNSLDAFVNQVGAEQLAGQIGAADAASLTGLANDIKARLGCS
jgi:hypothetical protein